MKSYHKLFLALILLITASCITQIKLTDSRPLLKIWLEHHQKMGGSTPQFHSLSSATQVIFRNGDTVNFYVSSNRRGYLYVLHRGTSGALHVLFPQKNNQNNFMSGNPEQITRFPQPSSGKIVVTPPAGREYFSFIISPQPLFSTPEFDQNQFVQFAQQTFANTQPAAQQQVGLCNQQGSNLFQTCNIFIKNLNIISNPNLVVGRDFKFMPTPTHSRPDADYVQLHQQDLQPSEMIVTYVSFFLQHE
jgi:hypothetical protein